MMLVKFLWWQIKWFIIFPITLVITGFKSIYSALGILGITVRRQKKKEERRKYLKWI